MPQEDDADSGDETDLETDSTDSNLLEMMKVLEEERQAAIDRVTFDRCELVREAGERYCDGESIPVIAVELAVPMMTVEKAVKTYYLLFSEPPLNEVSSRVFVNGLRYFEDSSRLEDLEAETRGEAEELVRAFVGRTLLENDLDTVDIERPLPEMPSTKLNKSVFVGMEALAESITDQFEPLGKPVVSQVGKSLAVETMQRSAEVMTDLMAQDMQRLADSHVKQTARRLQQVSAPTSLTTVMGPALASSVVGSAAVAGVDPSVFNTLSYPVNFGFEQVMATQLQPLVAELVEMLRRTGIETLMQSVAPLSSPPAIQDFTSLNQHVAEQLTPLAKQLSQMDTGVVGAGAMGAAAARPNVGEEFEVPDLWQAFEQPEGSWTPGELKPTNRGKNLDGNLSPAQLATHEQGDDIMDWVIVFSLGHGLQIAVHLATAAGAHVTGPHPGAEQVVYLAPAFGLIYVAWQWQQAVTEHRG